LSNKNGLRSTVMVGGESLRTAFLAARSYAGLMLISLR
jgi:hypothetical protein